MAKNKHKEKTLQTLAQKAAKKTPVATGDDTLGKEAPSSEEIARKENEEATKAETQAQVDNTKTEETAPAEKPAESEKPAEAATEDKPADKAPEKETKKETKEEKKARQKAEYEAKKAEKKAAKEAKKEAKKESEKKVDKNADIEEAVVVEETKTETKVEETKKPMDSKKTETTKTATVVDTKQTKIRNISAAIHETLKGDRMSADKQVEFLGMVKSEYLDKTDIPVEQRAAYAKIFNEGMAMNCLFLHHQIMKEGEEVLGVRLDDKVGPVLVTLLDDCWGVTARALPRGNDGQMRLEFDIPEDVKESIDADVTAVEEVAKEVANSEEKTFPEPDASLPLEEKLKILRAILSQPGTKQTKKEGKDQMTVNIYNGIEWARKAFGLEKDSPSQILAVMFEKLYKNEARPLSLAGASGRVWGITNTYNNLLTAHAILGPNYTFTNYTDEEVANIIKVLYASHLRYIAGKNLAAGKSNVKFTEEEIDKYQTEQGYEQLANVPDTVINAICGGTKLERKLKYLTDCNINGKLILDTISKQYGNSESIAKDIVKKLAPFYSSNLERIAKYADLSSYSK